MLRSQWWNMPQTSLIYRFVENDELRAAMDGVFWVFAKFVRNFAENPENSAKFEMIFCGHAHMILIQNFTLNLMIQFVLNDIYYSEKNLVKMRKNSEKWKNLFKNIIILRFKYIMIPILKKKLMKKTLYLQEKPYPIYKLSIFKFNRWSNYERTKCDL
jgi:hypothetical protein